MKISSLSVKEPNQYHFIKYVAAKQVFLGIHHDWLTFSLYESDATQTLYTFRQKEIDFENFHAKSMSFQAKENDDVYHFRVTFMASKSQLDTVYPWLSHCTGNGILVSALKLESKTLFPLFDRHIVIYLVDSVVVVVQAWYRKSGKLRGNDRHRSDYTRG